MPVGIPAGFRLGERGQLIASSHAKRRKWTQPREKNHLHKAQVQNNKQRSGGEEFRTASRGIYTQVEIE